jgi:hypothetical protein
MQRIENMNILVIDGMGGGIGKSIIEHIKSEYSDIEITAVGTNSLATSAMLKAGADNGATGENAVVFNKSGLYHRRNRDNGS